MKKAPYQTLVLLLFAIVSSANAQPQAPLWTFDAANLIRSSPAVGSDGTVYFGASGTLYAITNMGSNAWTFTTQGRVDNSPAVASDGTIYYGSSGYLYAVNPNGSQKWQYAVEGVAGSPALAADNTLFINAWYYLHPVLPQGTSKWTYPVQTGTSSHFAYPSLTSDGSVRVGIYGNKTFYASQRMESRNGVRYCRLRSRARWPRRTRQACSIIRSSQPTAAPYSSWDLAATISLCPPLTSEI